MKKTICIDLDGTIIDYKEGWKGPSHFGEIIPGAKEALIDLKAKGWEIIILTTRRDKEKVKNFLERNNIVFDYINENPNKPEGAGEIKPHASIYLDDKAINFDGNWSKALTNIYSFKRWEERETGSYNEDDNYNKFLERDFNQCFEQMRHYDSIESSLLKFAFGGFTAIIGASWALFGYSKKACINPSAYLGILLLTGALFESILLTLIVRTRIYFVNMARYINEHRRFFLLREPLGFKNLTKMHINYNFPQYFNPASSYSITFYLLSIGISVLFTTAFYYILDYFNYKISNALLIIVFIFTLIVSIGSVIIYLSKKESQKQKGIDLISFGKKAEIKSVETIEDD